MDPLLLLPSVAHEQTYTLRGRSKRKRAVNKESRYVEKEEGGERRRQRRPTENEGREGAAVVAAARPYPRSLVWYPTSAA